MARRYRVFGLEGAPLRKLCGEAIIVKEDSNSRTGSLVEAGPILVPVDFSPDSEAALLWACNYAAHVGADVVVLHVVHDPIEAPGSYRRSEADVMRPMEDVASEMMGQFIEKIGEAHTDLKLDAVATQLVLGIPENRILEVAEKEGASMIVMGSRGRTGLPHLLLGSKAEHVAQRAAIPVTIVKAGAEDE